MAKEHIEDLGINLSDYGARYYDPAIARWSTIDPLAEEYASFSGYNYTLGNPIKYIDPDGMRVDFSALYTNDDGTLNKEGLITAANLISELQDLTGLSLSVKDGFLTEGTSTQNCTGAEICGSSGARDYVRGLISDDRTLAVSNNNGIGSRAIQDENGNATNSISINNNEAEYFRSTLAWNGVDGLTWSYGTTFLHESLHTPMGASQMGKTSKQMEHNGGSLGPISIVNTWRTQNGLGTRRNHGPRSHQGWDREWIVDVPRANGSNSTKRLNIAKYKSAMALKQ